MYCGRDFTCPGRGMGSLCSLKLFGPYRWVVCDSRFLGKLMIEIAANGHCRQRKGTPGQKDVGREERESGGMRAGREIEGGRQREGQREEERERASQIETEEEREDTTLGAGHHTRNRWTEYAPRAHLPAGMLQRNAMEIQDATTEILFEAYPYHSPSHHRLQSVLTLLQKLQQHQSTYLLHADTATDAQRLGDVYDGAGFLHLHAQLAHPNHWA